MIEWLLPEKRNWLHDVHAGAKFFVIFVLLVIALVNWNPTFALYQAVVYTTLLFFVTGLATYKIGLLSLPAIISAFSTFVTMTLFGRGETVYWQWLIFKVSEESVRQGILLALKTLAFSALSLFLLVTTNPMLLAYSLMQQFKLPSKYAYSFIASIRLLPIIVEEFQARRNALMIRGIQFSKGWRGVGERLEQYTVPLFAQSIRRAQRIAVAMESKQYHMGKSRTYYYETTYTKRDALFILIMSVLVMSLYVLARLFPLSFTFI